ncbi:hypothetical protein EDB87DRAFT_735072 [Lactarius vividus]|nr:hypothetical protein EDB87DRAFT_735072 [Lactarius vividus]
MLSLLATAAHALIPLVWSTLFSLDLCHALSLRSVFLTSVSMCALTYTIFPFENLALRHASGGSKIAEKLLVMLQLLSVGIAEMGYSASYMYISSAVPNKRSLGATNGLAHTVASIQRMVGPAAADGLFAFSLMNNVLGGNFAYMVLVVLVGVGLVRFGASFHRTCGYIAATRRDQTPSTQI